MAWLSTWSHRKTVTITGETGAGEDYQVPLSIGDSSGGDFHLEGHCTSFPNDITVTDNDRTTLLDHWVEDLTVDPISMWVEVADDLGINVDVCVYYDKLGESSASNGDNTFNLFDHFDNEDWTDKWQDAGGAGSPSRVESGTTLQLTSADFCAVKLLNSLPADNYRIKTKSKLNSVSNYNVGFAMIKSDTNSITWLKGSGGYFIYIRDGLRRLYRMDIGTSAVLASNTLSTDTAWHMREVWTTGTTAYALYDAAQQSALDSTYTSFIDVLLAQGSDGAQTVEFDWIFARRFHDPEPAFDSAGAEENAPTFVPYPLLSGMDGGIGESMEGGIAR